MSFSLNSVSYKINILRKTSNTCFYNEERHFSIQTTTSPFFCILYYFALKWPLLTVLYALTLPNRVKDQLNCSISLPKFYVWVLSPVLTFHFFFMTQQVGVAFILDAAVCRFVIHGITYIWSVESLPLISLCPTVGSSTLYDRLLCFTASHDIKSLRAVESNQLSRHHVPYVAGVFSLICSNPNRACRTNMRFHRQRPRLYSHSGNMLWSSQGN